MNLPAVDADRIEGLASWVDVSSEQPVAVDYSKVINKRKVGWFWNRPVMEKILSSTTDLIVCGSADNQLDFYSMFETTVFLSLPANEQLRRIRSRSRDGYGQAPGMAEQIIREQTRLLADYQELGAVIMNANRNPHAIATDISKYLQ
jgi:hypothetical protein